MDLDYNDEGRNIVTREHDPVAPEDAAVRVRRAITEGKARAVSGKDVAVVAESICVHSDAPGARRLPARCGRPGRIRLALRASRGNEADRQENGGESGMKRALIGAALLAAGMLAAAPAARAVEQQWWPVKVYNLIPASRS